MESGKGSTKGGQHPMTYPFKMGTDSYHGAGCVMGPEKMNQHGQNIQILNYWNKFKEHKITHGMKKAEDRG